jgi:hypothetical protein
MSSGSSATPEQVRIEMRRRTDWRPSRHCVAVLLLGRWAHFDDRASASVKCCARAADPEGMTHSFDRRAALSALAAFAASAVLPACSSSEPILRSLDLDRNEVTLAGARSKLRYRFAVGPEERLQLAVLGSPRQFGDVNPYNTLTLYGLSPAGHQTFLEKYAGDPRKCPADFFAHNQIDYSFFAADAALDDALKRVRVPRFRGEPFTAALTAREARFIDATTEEGWPLRVPAESMALNLGTMESHPIPIRYYLVTDLGTDLRTRR